jgi:hypothetical protein
VVPVDVVGLLQRLRQVVQRAGLFVVEVAVVDSVDTLVAPAPV